MEFSQGGEELVIALNVLPCDYDTSLKKYKGVFMLEDVGNPLTLRIFLMKEKKQRGLSD
ncbi:MAG: hypothetical protein NT163_06730 [Chlorobiales bacterium]|nr:hypothetical protein [Chlorobiales bacterium]